MPLTAINADESARVSVCRFGFVQAVISAGVLQHRMSGMKPSVPKSVDEYIAVQPDAMRPKLEQLRAAHG